MTTWAAIAVFIGFLMFFMYHDHKTRELERYASAWVKSSQHLEECVSELHRLKLAYDDGMSSSEDFAETVCAVLEREHLSRPD